MAGRKRKHNPHIPIHIDQTKLPDCVYWDKSGVGRWYISYSEEGKQKTKTIAQKNATLSELHKLAEEFKDSDSGTLNELIKAYTDSIQFKQTGKETRRKYVYGSKLAAEFPSKTGKPLGTYKLSKFTAPVVQKLIDGIAVQRGPTAARHCLRFMTRAFRWGNGRGFCGIEGVSAIEAPKEAKKRVLPELQAYNNVIQFAQERGAWPANKEGSLPPWLWCIIEICYLCRLRGIEAVTLTDANETERGIATNRRKGSRDNVVMWSPRLTAAWDAAKFVRQQTRTRKKLPTSTRAEDRWIFLNGDNMHIRRDAVSKDMKRLMDLAIKAEVITEEQRFTLHPVKRRGTTDTKGNRADKQTATGHKSAAMLDIYDMELPEVQPSGSS